MPVSTCSSGSPALRQHGGAMMEPWSRTREGREDDSRRLSHGSVNEMDGTGLYERPNWPFPEERSVSPERPEEAEARRRQREEMEHVHQEAVMRKSEDIERLLDDPEFAPHDDVSDLDADEEREAVDVVSEMTVGQHSSPGAEAPSDMRLETSLARGAKRDTAIYNPPVIRRHTPDHVSTGESNGSRVSPPDVSPVRRGQALPDSSAPRPSLEAGNSYNRLRRVWRETRDSFQQNRDGFAASGGTFYHEAGDDDDDDDDDDFDDDDDNDDEDEARDLATPMPHDRERRPSPATSYEALTPQMNDTTIPSIHGTPQSNGHARPGSMMKQTPPSRNSSRLSNSHTTHLPRNKDRVRYSWQSVQDDEPNRPRIHIIKLVSEVATASAGFPGGEAFGFSLSPAGKRIAVYNSARLYVLQTAALPVGISQDYALKRRPLAVEVVDDGDVMAILADAHTINVYDLGHHRLRRTKTIKLDFPSNCIALAPSGGLLAAAYEGGVEIFSLDPTALPTDRRAIRSPRMDRLAFSEDGSTLLGTTTRINVSSTVVVSVPVFPAAPNGIPTHEELKEAWCSELLHPENIRNSSHATFMRDNRRPCNDRLFAWNGSADTFGILNVANLEYGNVDFPVVISPPLSTCGGLGAAIHSCPAIDEHGDTVAMIVNDRTVRLYIVPPNAHDGESILEAHSIDHELDEGYGCPFSEARWVYSSASVSPSLHHQNVRGRLIVTSPGGVVEQGMSEEYVDDIEGGRIIMLDFDPQFAGQPGQTFSLTLGRSPPQMLEEEEANVAEQVALVRRRTVNQSRGVGLSQGPASLGRAATTYNRDRSLRAPSPAFGGHYANRRSMLNIGTLHSDATRSLPDLLETNEVSEVLEEPFQPGAPRSHASLQRAASNAQRFRYQMLEERTQDRASTDSHGTFLPLPEYTEEPNAPLPSRFRAMAGLDAPPQPPPKPSVQTSVKGASAAGSAVVSAPTGSMTAPAATAESFDADQAFRTAQATLQQQREDAIRARMGSPTPESGPSTMDAMRAAAVSPIGTMPRGLARAYSNAATISGAVSGNASDRRAISPMPPSRNNSSLANSRPFSPVSPGASNVVPEEETWDMISPITERGQTPTAFNRTLSSSHPYNRFSTSAHAAQTLDRAPSAASSYYSSPSLLQHSPTTPAAAARNSRHLPPHMQAFRNAAAANAAAAASSLFPSPQSADQIPYRLPPTSAGSVAHPVTGWHPPAPSVVSLPAAGAAGGGGGRRPLSSKSSVAGQSGFASTTRARRLAFLGRGRKKVMPAVFPEGSDGDVGDTRSMVTWGRNDDATKCQVM
ncbi:F-box domain protein [Teratosphaeria destructans]|uniref:F-box domain protein n=1 Tax=Teratosphaeria destructans TaxID=418781 RepID=A0A9W7SXX0_9PEZI|nr:F-box domain protein [Teratosphaeria destructans]